MIKNSDLANAIRFLSVDMIEKAKSGHPGMPLGIADIMTVLYKGFIKHYPKDPTWPDRDRFVLSAGHASAALYSTLHLTGYEAMTPVQIKNFRQINSLTPGHPEYGLTPGIETTTGLLGQGLGNAVGMAIAEKLLREEFGRDMIDHYTYALVGDGCLMEGVSLETIALAGHLKLNKLIVLWDNNSVTIDGPTDLTMTGNHLGRLRDSDWNVMEVDGHDFEQIHDALVIAKKSPRPTFISCKTIIAYGCPTKAGSSISHGAPLGEEEIKGLRDNLNWPYEPFDIPQDILNTWREIGRIHEEKHTTWIENFLMMPTTERENFVKRIKGILPAEWNSFIPEFKQLASTEKYNWATRRASGKVLERLNKNIPYLVGGSADLTESNFTRTEYQRVIDKDASDGRYIYYGAREHGMSAIMNGISLHGGYIPYGGTFLIFTDYMKAGMRMSALMKQRVVYVLTHDSIGLGEDGPTHQPVETLSTLRAMPNMYVFRPADAVEVVECWELALLRMNGPSVMSLTRQAVPTVRHQHTNENLSIYGAYILEEASSKREVTLIATGSEVSIAVEARKILEESGIPTAVISMPCYELFERQSVKYREHVLGVDALRVGVEAGCRYGWDRYIGINGLFFGIFDEYGRSGKYEDLYEYYGITPSNIADVVTSHLRVTD